MPAKWPRRSVPISRPNSARSWRCVKRRPTSSGAFARRRRPPHEKRGPRPKNGNGKPGTRKKKKEKDELNLNRVCYGCHGSKTQPCHSCRGFNVSFRYGNYALGTCSSCYKKGTQMCSECRGSGTITRVTEKDWIKKVKEFQDKHKPCTSCRSSKTPSGTLECAWCHGKGTCGPKGKDYCSHCNGWGKKFCSSCSGGITGYPR